MQRNMIGNTIRGLLLIAAVAGGVIALLAVANWLPSLVQKDTVRKYATVQDAKRDLSLDRVLIPAYFPSGITWPPAVILAQKDPYEAIVLEFRKAGTEEIALIITQSALRGGDARLQRVTLSEVKEKTEYRLKGRSAVLEVGICDNGSTCSRIAWQESELHCTVLLMSGPFDLIRMAESMIH